MTSTQTDTDIRIEVFAKSGRNAGGRQPDGTMLYPAYLRAQRGKHCVEIRLAVDDGYLMIPEDEADLAAPLRNWTRELVTYIESVVDKYNIGIDETKTVFKRRIQLLVKGYEVPLPSREELTNPEAPVELEAAPAEAEVMEYQEGLQNASPQILILRRIVLKRQAGIYMLDPDEAAAVLGIPNNTSVMTKMNWLIRNGFLENSSRNGQTTFFWRPDLDALAVRLARGEIKIPTSL